MPTLHTQSSVVGRSMPREGDAVYLAGCTGYYDTGHGFYCELTHGQRGHVEHNASGDERVRVKFPASKAASEDLTVRLRIGDLSTLPPMPLPGGLKLGDAVVVTKDMPIEKGGLRVCHGDEGVVVGPAGEDKSSKSVSVRFGDPRPGVRHFPMPISHLKLKRKLIKCKSRSTLAELLKARLLSSKSADVAKERVEMLDLSYRELLDATDALSRGHQKEMRARERHERKLRDRLQMLKVTSQPVHLISSPYHDATTRAVAEKIKHEVEAGSFHLESAVCFNPNTDLPAETSGAADGGGERTWQELLERSIATGGAVWVIYRADGQGQYHSPKGANTLEGEAQVAEVQAALQAKGCRLLYVETSQYNEAGVVEAGATLSPVGTGSPDSVVPRPKHEWDTPLEGAM